MPGYILNSMLTMKAKLKDNLSKDDIQTAIFDVLKKNNLSPRDVFSAFYQVVIGKPAGPRASDIIVEFGADKVKKRLQEVLQKAK